MTHEPECIYVEGTSHWVRHDGECGFCFIARLAYQRGLIAAANIADNRHIDMMYCMKDDDCHTKAAGAKLVADDIRYAAARGGNNE